MDKTILVENKISEGKALLDALRKRHITLKDAMWGYDEDQNSWKLIITSPVINKEGPLYLYGLIDKLLKKQKYKEIRLENIDVMDTNDIFIKLFRSAYKKRQKIYNDISLQDAYIYFIEK